MEHTNGCRGGFDMAAIIDADTHVDESEAT